MSTMWRCGVCETVNRDARSCTACGAQLTRRSAVATSVRGRVAPEPVPPPVPPWGTLPEPVQRAINREPVPAEEWEPYETGPSFDIKPLPGGCLVVAGPRHPR